MKVLGWLAYVLRWAEELLIIVSGPLLTFGLGIALVDLLTDGALLTTQPSLLYAWAISQAAGVDAQLGGSAAKLARHAHEGHPWRALGYGVLIVPLAYVAFLASNVFATQEASGIGTAEALARLGMDGTTWILQRSALAVLLVILSGLLRYVPDKATDAADERATLEREAELEPLRQRVRAARALGMVGLGRQIVAAATGHDVVTPTPTPTPPAEEPPVRTQDTTPVRTQADAAVVVAPEPTPVETVEAPETPPETPDTPPTGPGTPVRKPSVRTPDEGGREPAPYIQLQRPPEWRQKRTARGHARPVRKLVASRANVEPQARAAWRDGMTVGQLRAAANISRTAAAKYRKQFNAEGAQAQQVRQVAQ